MKRCVCSGGRDFEPTREDESAFRKAMTDNEITVVVHGGARGADKFFDRLARDMGITVVEMRPDYNEEGVSKKQAPLLRNTRMVDYTYPGFCYSVPGGNGTADLVKKAASKGLCFLSKGSQMEMFGA